MTDQPPDARPNGEDPAGRQVVVALDEYRRAVRAVASAAPAALLRARAERRTARNRAVTVLASTAAVVAVLVGAVSLADRADRPGPPQVGQQPATSAPASPVPASPSGASTRSGGSAPTASGATETAPISCRPAALFARMGRSTISGTEATSTIELINTGAPCTVSGHVGLRLRAGDGGPITTSVQRQPGTTVTVTIATGGSAVAPIAWTWSDSSGTRCQAPYEVAVTLPGDTAAVTAPWVAGDAGLVCHGVVKVYPLRR